MAEYEKKFVMSCPETAAIFLDAVKVITIFGIALKKPIVFRLP